MQFLVQIKNFWIKIGETLGNIMAPIILTVVYFIILGPISLIAWFTKKDFLNQKQKKSTYWIAAPQKNINSLDELELPF